ncbi:MAG: maleylpyruvate isomerase family mycothiol-dependent enzyme [Nocardioidaceae bacterium]
MDPLAGYIAAWKHSAADVEDLVAELDDAEWARPTDCPGWSVRDVVAHLAAIESELAGAPGPDVDGEVIGTRDVTTAYTRAGIEERRDRTPAELVSEFVEAVRTRMTSLDADPPQDPDGSPPVTPGGIGWDWQTLLRNRVVDLWVHEQDIRRAVERPGGMQSPGAQVVAATFTAALPFVIGKKASAVPGSSVVVDLDGRQMGYAVGPDGRCRGVEPIPHDPTVRLELGVETFTILGAGRRDPLTTDAQVSGDRDLGERILHGLAVTP